MDHAREQHAPVIHTDQQRSAPFTTSAARLGWETLSQGAQLLRLRPTDDEIRVGCVQSLVRLGLGDLALRVREQIRSPERLEQILIDSTETTAIPTHTLATQARDNLQQAGLHAMDDIVDTWIKRGTAYHRAADGNVVRVPSSGADITEWAWIGDVREQARAFCAQHLSAGTREAFGPVTIEGVNPPWLLMALHAALPKLPDGYLPRFHLMQRDPSDLVEGFALADLSSVLDRTQVFVGEEAPDAYRQFVRARFDYPMTGPVVQQPDLKVTIEPPIIDLVCSIGEEQRSLATSMHQQLMQREQGRDQAYWRARYSTDGPKRVLIPTCRYSTYIQHACRDLALAFERRGWEARVLIEPDDHCRLSSIAYHRAQLTFDPDLIVLINYPRASRADALPTNTPFVCWIQDAMPHLFDERIGRSHGQHDFVFGHIYPKLFRECGYPSDRATGLPVVASSEKFHSAPITSEQRQRFACEMAFVSHQSETPQAMHARLCGEAGDQNLVAVLHEMRRVLGERYAQITAQPEYGIIKSIPGEAWARIHKEPPNERILSQLREQYLVPILERVLRHEMLEWASEVADRRGWSLKIFGRGWDEHPTLSRFAAGELAHGDELRASYQAATVHLHASMCTLVHQRVMECALSGGVPICRIIEPNLGASRQSALLQLTLQGVAADEIDRNGMLGYHTGNHQSLQHYASLLESIGMTAPRTVWLHPSTANDMRSFPCAFEHITVEELLGNLAEGTVRSAAGLEAVVHRALQQPEWRQARSESIANRVRERLTHDAAVAKMTQLVERTMKSSERSACAVDAA